jgi:hypothetical protein
VRLSEDEPWAGDEFFKVDECFESGKDGACVRVERVVVSEKEFSCG